LISVAVIASDFLIIGVPDEIILKKAVEPVPAVKYRAKTTH